MNGEQNTKALVVAESRAVQKVPKNYWDVAAARYHLAQRTLLLVLVLFVFLFMVVCSGAFTYDSIMFFAEDLHSLSGYAPSDSEAVPYTYAEGEVQTLAFRGGIARVTAERTEIFAANGELLVQSSQHFNTPRAAASRKYVISYDCGGTELAVHNSYARLQSIQTDFPILLVSVSDSGYFAVVTAANDAVSRVLLYDNRFNLVQSFSRGSATVGVAISPNGQQIALMGARADGGNVSAAVDIYRSGAAEPQLSYMLQGEFPLACEFMSAKRLFVMTAAGAHVLGVKTEQRTDITFNGAVPKAYSVHEKGGAVVLEDDRLTMAGRAITFDEKGNITLDVKLTGNLLAVAAEEERVIVLAEGNIFCLEEKKEEPKVFSCPAGARGIWKSDDEGVYLFYEAEAALVAFSNG